MIEMQLGGLGFDPKNMSPIVLLRDLEERNFLPIWIGMFEAAAIAMELQDFKPPRPMTHDLVTVLLDKLKARLQRVIINEIVDDTFYAVIEVSAPATAGDDILKIDARPSDAIALAVRAHVPIFVSESVMMKAKMVNAEKDDEEANKFKSFIDNINPDDFQRFMDNKQ
jgi:bifunctional DNase/RNase